MDLSFLSLKDIYGTNHIYHLSSAISRKGGKSIMDILWRIYLMERNAVFTAITKVTVLKQNQF